MLTFNYRDEFCYSREKNIVSPKEYSTKVSQLHKDIKRERKIKIGKAFIFYLYLIFYY